jgi:hypothetical protein
MEDFKKHNGENEDELRGLLDQIRQHGTPYSEEPDPLYFANFRVRLMERVEAKPLGIFARVREWFAVSNMRTSLVGGSLAALLLGGVYFGMQGTDAPSVAKNDNPPAIQQTPGTAGQTGIAQGDTANGQVNPATPEQPKSIEPMLDPTNEAPQIAQNSTTPETSSGAQRDSAIVNDVAAAAPLLLADNEGPAASLEDLTEAELQSLLHSIEEMN